MVLTRRTLGTLGMIGAQMAPRHPLAVPFMALVLACSAGGAVLDGREDPRDSRLAKGFDLAYNLDYDAAIETFRRVIAERPQDPAGHRSIAAATWLRILFLRGDILTDNYLAALNASYRGSVLGERLGALTPARRAYAAHQKVLELDPTRAEAKLLIGLYRYVVASMPGPGAGGARSGPALDRRPRAPRARQAGRSGRRAERGARPLCPRPRPLRRSGGPSLRASRQEVSDSPVHGRRLVR